MRTTPKSPQQLHLGQKTVRNYVSRIYGKLDLSNRAQVATYLARTEAARGPDLAHSAAGRQRVSGPRRMNEQPLNIRTSMREIWRRRVRVLIVAVLCGLAGVAYGFLTPTKATAVALVLLPHTRDLGAPSGPASPRGRRSPRARRSWPPPEPSSRHRWEHSKSRNW